MAKLLQSGEASYFSVMQSVPWIPRCLVGWVVVVQGSQPRWCSNYLAAAGCPWY